jgi:hypothetical protein
MLIVMGGFFFLISDMLYSIPPEADAPPPSFFFGIIAFVLVFNVLLTIPALVAGYGLLKKKTWGRVAGIVAAVCAAMSFPFGTALCVYALWFFFGEAGKAMPCELAGSSPRGTLTGHDEAPRMGWGGQTVGGERQHTYAQPPDWRGQ